MFDSTAPAKSYAVNSQEVYRTTHTFIHKPTEEEYTVIIVDAEDTTDVYIHYPNDERECVWSLVQDKNLEEIHEHVDAMNEEFDEDDDDEDD
jgi:hypothetical protein